MKNLKNLLALAAIVLSLSSCSVSKPLVFGNEHWTLHENGYIANKDSTSQFFLSEGLVNAEMTIIDSPNTVAKYPGLDKHLQSILKDAHLAGAEILFYAPGEQMLIVKAPEGRLPWKPASETVGLNEERPFTSWVYEDDHDEGPRKADEIFSYTIVNNKERRILVVDFFDYGSTPIAYIRVLQSRTKKTDKMGLPADEWCFQKHDLRNYKRELEFWSHSIEAHRNIAIENYKLGQKLKRH